MKFGYRGVMPDTSKRPPAPPKRGEAAWRAQRDAIASRNEKASRKARARRQGKDAKKPPPGGPPREAKPTNWPPARPPPTGESAQSWRSANRKDGMASTSKQKTTMAKLNR